MAFENAFLLVEWPGNGMFLPREPEKFAYPRVIE